MRCGIAPSMLAAIARASTVFAVPGTSSSRTWPSQTRAASTSLISSRLPWTTVSMLSSRRSEMAPARSKRSGSGGESTAAMVAGLWCEVGVVIPRATPFYARGAGFVSARLRQRFRAGDDLEDLLRDLRLARAVHAQRQRVDDLAGVLRCVPHRRHARALLRRRGLEQRAVDLRLDVDREQPLEDLLRLRLEDEVAAERVVRALLVLRRQHLCRDRKEILLRHPLRERGDVRVVDEDDAIDLALGEELGHAVRDRLGIGVLGPVREAHERPRELPAAEEERRAPLLADRDPADLLALALERALESERAPHDLGVERAGEPAVPGERDDCDSLDRLALLEERQANRRGRPPHSCDELVHRL